MKQTSSRDLRTQISRISAMLALAMLVAAFMSPGVFEQIIAEHSFNNSPLGIMSSVEHIIFGIK